MRSRSSSHGRLAVPAALVVLLSLAPLGGWARNVTALGVSEVQLPTGYRPPARPKAGLVQYLVRLDERCFLPADRYRPADWLTLLPSTRVVLTADGHGLAAAVAACAINRAPKGTQDSLALQGVADPRATYISSIAVDPGHRRKRLAEYLLSDPAVVPPNLNAYLHVRASNAGAIALYRKLGFEVVKRIPSGHYYEGDVALLMRRLALPEKRN